MQKLSGEEKNSSTEFPVEVLKAVCCIFPQILVVDFPLSDRSLQIPPPQSSGGAAVVMARTNIRSRSRTSSASASSKTNR